MVDEIRALRLLSRATNSVSLPLIEASVEQAMRKAIGLRNVLVHEYVGVDDSIVLARIEDLTDIDDFASQVADWLAASD